MCLNKSELYFNGCNSLIYLGTGEHKVNISTYNDSVCHCGRFTVYTDRLQFIIAEHKHCFIGDSCMIASGVVIQNSDAHLIYSCDDGNRINLTKSVYIGDHVWIGQNVCILKGTQIDSGSIVGSRSVVAGKKIQHNSVCAGSPLRNIRRGVFWDKTCIYNFTEEMTETTMNYHKFISEKQGCHSDYWIYEYDENQTIEWDYLESAMSHGTALEKCSFLIELNAARSKNRFVHTLI